MSVCVGKLFVDCVCYMCGEVTFISESYCIGVVMKCMALWLVCLCY